MSSYGTLSTMAYAAVVTWGFWRFMTIGQWTPEVPAMIGFAMVLLAARVFATMIHTYAMRGNR